MEEDEEKQRKDMVMGKKEFGKEEDSGGESRDMVKKYGRVTDV